MHVCVSCGLWKARPSWLLHPCPQVKLPFEAGRNWVWTQHGSSPYLTDCSDSLDGSDCALLGILYVGICAWEGNVLRVGGGIAGLGCTGGFIDTDLEVAKLHTYVDRQASKSVGR